MSNAPSDWIVRWAHLVPPGSHVLDVACGSGRHVRWFAQRGNQVICIDRDEASATPLREVAEVVVADIENGPWPLNGQQFDAVIVTNYLWRPLLPTLFGSVAPGGVLLYETFAQGNEQFGRPSRADFLLQPGELLRGVNGQLEVLGFESGRLESPTRVVQRIAARRPPLVAADNTPALLPEAVGSLGRMAGSRGTA